MERIEQASEGFMVTSAAKGSAITAGGLVSGMEFLGIDLPALVQALTAIYLVIMIIHGLWKWSAEWRYERRREKEEIKQ